MTFVLSREIDVSSAVPGLEARRWAITSELPEKIEATWGPATLTLRPDAVTLRGFQPQELFGSGADREKAGVVGGALALFLGPGRRD